MPRLAIYPHETALRPEAAAMRARVRSYASPIIKPVVAGPIVPATIEAPQSADQAALVVAIVDAVEAGEVGDESSPCAGYLINVRRPMLPKDRLALVARIVGRVFGEDPAAILSELRFPPLAHARQTIAWIMRRWTNMSYPQIGRLLRRDSSTIVHSCQSVDRALTSASVAMPEEISIAEAAIAIRDAFEARNGGSAS